jgi:hypothetical protein
MYRRSTAAAFCRDMRKEQNRIMKAPRLTGVRGELMSEKDAIEAALNDPKTGIVQRVLGEVRLIVIDQIIAENRWARFQEKGA